MSTAKIIELLHECADLTAEMRRTLEKYAPPGDSRDGELICDGCKRTWPRVKPWGMFGLNLCGHCRETAARDPMFIDELAHAKKRGTGVRRSWSGD